MLRAKRMKSDEIRGLLGLARRARGLTIGSRETRIALRRGEVYLVLLASDGSPRDRERLERVTEEAGVPTCVAGSRVELGDAIGTGEVSVLGVRDRNLAAGLAARLKETDTRTGPGDSGGERE
jgi:ribosomal protein L7Ae-like RNA K-turn-binding protein